MGVRQEKGFGFYDVKMALKFDFGTSWGFSSAATID